MRSLLTLLLALFALLAHAEPLPPSTPLFTASYVGTDGKALKLDDLRGKPIVVNFWARWCGPCRKEIPDLVEIGRRYRSKGLTIVGIAVEDAQYREAVADFAKAYEVDYRIALAGVEGGIALMKQLGNDKAGLPFTVIIDRQGRLVQKKLGAMNLEALEAAVKPVL